MYSLNLSFALRMELSHLGIEVSAFCPGDTKTNFTENRIKDDTTSDKYGDRLATATENSDSREDKRMPVEVVAEKIFKTINKTKLKPFYIVGGKYKFLYFLTRITPKSWLLSGTNKKLGGSFTKVEKKTKPAKEQPAVNKIDTTNETNVAQENISTEESVNVAETPATESTVENTDNTTNLAQETITENTEAETPKEPSNNLNNLLNKMTGLKKPTETSENNTTENN